MERCDFIFIGGVQPKKISLDHEPLRCPKCGLPRAGRFREDLYFSLFFIPLFPVKKGESYLECANCGPIGAQSGAQPKGPGRLPAPSPRPEARKAPANCPVCGRPTQADHRYCPYCGQRLI